MKKTLSLTALPLAFLFIGPAFAQAPQSMCVIAGNNPIMGANGTADFDVHAQGCMSDIRPRGTLTSSEVSQRPQHGTVTMVDKDTWTYVPTSGYVGSDSFAITAKGQSIDQKPGTSVLSYKVTVK
jgi:Bacterial Ig domain